MQNGIELINNAIDYIEDNIRHLSRGNAKIIEKNRNFF